MAKKYNGPITIDTDWGGDESTGGLPVAGETVQTFIRDRLRIVEARSELTGSFTLADDARTGKLVVTDRNDDPILTIPMELPAGGGASDGTVINRITATATATALRQGDPCTVTAEFESFIPGTPPTPSGYTADITLEIINSGITLHTATLRAVPAGKRTFDIGSHLRTGENLVRIRASVTDAEGTVRVHQAAIRIIVMAVTLTTTYSPAESVAGGGYSEGQEITIPYTLSGAGVKTVTLYIDGEQHGLPVTDTRATVRRAFTISSLLPGHHVAQLVATATEEGITVSSQSIYIDLWVRDNDATPTPLIAILHTDPTGRILGTIRDEWRTPSVTVEERGTLRLRYAAWSPASAGTHITVTLDGQQTQTLNIPAATEQTLVQRISTAGTHTLVLAAESITRTVGITAEKSDTDIEISTQALIFSLDATGRSNTESNPAQWSESGVHTTFRDVDWRLSGWTGEALRLTSGASASIGWKPFATSPTAKGLTIEATLRITSIADREKPVMECIDTLPSGSLKGLRITGHEIAFYTGETVSYTDEDGNPASRPVRLSTNYPEGEWMKIALVIRPAYEGAGDRLMELYVNGGRVGAEIYAPAYSFTQADPADIIFRSEGADLEIRSVRAYQRDLTDDECLDNHIADTTDPELVRTLSDDNDILTADGSQVSMAALLEKGKGVLRIVRQNKLTDVFRTNNKKADFEADVFFTSPFGPEHSFTLRHCYIRIQGTSSTKYPSKNLRIYLTKGTPQLSLTGGSVTDNGMWPLRPGAKPVPILCAKADYSDSSMTLNTGGARLFNDTLKTLGLLTPPQQWQKDHGAEITVRSAIDGYPIDIFVSATESGPAEYVGQYNLNNEKSKSGRVFGMEDVEGYAPQCPIALETLNNTSPVCLFTTASDTELATLFDSGCEVNYGTDTAGKIQADGDCAWKPDQGKKITELSSKAKNAIRRLHTFIRSCIPAGADPADISTYISAKFRAEAASYFDTDFLCAYYLFTDYMASVDQRAKNMLIRTWDGLMWYITYYDGDTQLGKRNDTFLKYLYTVNRDTRDDEMGKYAFEGHDSALWCLLLANFDAELRAMAERLRSVMTTQEILRVLNEEQAASWPTRLYNKSGEIKYIMPATVGTPTAEGGAMQKWPFIYALQGANTPHRGYFVRNRCALLDARWGVSGAKDDNIDLYISRRITDSPSTVRIIATEPYVFGYGTNNSPDMATTGIIDAGRTATLTIDSAFTINDPLRLYGASRIRSLDLRGSCGILKNGLNLSKCRAMETLDLSVAVGQQPSTSWWLEISSCQALRTISLRGQTGAATYQGSSILDFTGQPRLQTLDLSGTRATGLLLAPGAPVTRLTLPATLTSLTLDSHRTLSSSGLILSEGTALRTLTVRACPGLDSASLVSEHISTLESLTAEGVEWSGFAVSTLLRLAEIGAIITGRIEVPGTVGFEEKRKLVAAFGDIDSGASGLKVVYAPVELTPAVAVTILTELCYVKAGKYPLVLDVSNPAANSFRSIKWSISKNSYATIDETSGELDIKDIGTEADAPTAEVTCSITLVDGSVRTVTATVLLYERSARVGDYVFADGTYAPGRRNDKTIVGVCVWVDSNDKSKRIAAAVDRMSSKLWGLVRKQQNGYEYRPTLADDPSYDTEHVLGLSNKVPGVPKTADDYYALTEDNYLDASTPDGFKVFPESTALGELCFISAPFSYGPVAKGTFVPQGAVNTMCIIRHRNKVLSDSGINRPIPMATTSSTEMENLEELIRSVTSEDAKYELLYYPPASRCFAYEPTRLKQGESLAPAFKAGRWFLPAIAELTRGVWIAMHDTSDSAKYLRATSFSDPGWPGSSAWSSSENGEGQYGGGTAYALGTDLVKGCPRNAFYKGKAGSNSEYAFAVPFVAF